MTTKSHLNKLTFTVNTIYKNVQHIDGTQENKGRIV